MVWLIILRVGDKKRKYKEQTLVVIIKINTDHFFQPVYPVDQ